MPPLFSFFIIQRKYSHVFFQTAHIYGHDASDQWGESPNEYTMMAQRFLFESFLFYAVFESAIFGLAVALNLILGRYLHRRPRPTSIQIVQHYLAIYTLSILFAASMKYLWHFSSVDYDSNYFLAILDGGNLVFAGTVGANLIFQRYARTVFSQQPSPGGRIFTWISLGFASLFLFPSMNSLVVDIFLLLQTLMVYLPVCVKAQKFRRGFRNQSKKWMDNLFYFSLIMCLVWLWNVCDGIWDLSGGRSFGPFYYLIWLTACLGLYTAARGNLQLLKALEGGAFPPEMSTAGIPIQKNLGIESEQNLESSFLNEAPSTDAINQAPEARETPLSQVTLDKVAENPPQLFDHDTKPVDQVLITCPHCGTSSFFPLSPNLHQMCISAANGLTSVFIPSSLVCSHFFIVFIDRRLNVRRYETLDYSQDPRAILGYLPDLFFVINRDEIVLAFYGNPAYLAKPMRRAVGNKIEHFLPASAIQQVRESIAVAFRQKAEHRIQFEVNGYKTRRVFEARHIPISELTMLSVIQDITERIKAEEMLLEERLRVQKMESISLLAGGIAHDFNNLLVSIMGSVDLLKLDSNIKEESREILADLGQAAQRAKDLTRQLLVFAKGGSSMRKKTFLPALLQESISLTMRGSNCICEPHFAENLPELQLDQSQLSQVFNNLIINACQAMPSGGVLRVTAETVQLSKNDEIPLPPGEYVRVQFADEGEGIPEEMQGRIFEPYFTTKATGTGLGLATSFSIIKNHGGYITFQSAKSMGTVFTMFFPATHRQD